MDDVLARLTEAAKAKMLTVFAGAGISMGPPTSTPSWFQFRDLILEQLAQFLTNDMLAYQNIVRGVVDDLRASTIRPEIILEAIDRFGGMSSVVDFASTLNNSVPNSGHQSLAQLIREGLVTHVVTPNWDTYLEQALGSDHPLTPKSPSPDFTDLEAGERVLLHVHGSIANRGFVQAGQYRLGVAPEVAQVLQRILCRTQCLFLGYSGSDHDVLPILRRSLETSDTVYYWLVKPSSTPSAMFKALLDDFPHRIILIYDDLTAFLTRLCHRFGLSDRRCVNTSDIAKSATNGLSAAVTKFGHAYCYLTLALAAAAVGKWDSARWLSEFAVDVVYSPRIYPGRTLHWLASEAYRYAAVCAACNKNADHARSLINLSEQESRNATFDQTKARQARQVSNGLILLCADRFQEAESRFLNVLNEIRAAKHFFWDCKLAYAQRIGGCGICPEHRRRRGER